MERVPACFLRGGLWTHQLLDLLGHGIFAVDGAQWVHQRKTASNLFTARALRDTMTESMRRYTIVLQRVLQKGFWKLQWFLNVGPEAQLKQCTAEIDKTVMTIIAESLARRGEKPDPSQKAPTSADIVSLFLDRFDGSSGEQFDPVYLRDIVVNFLIAGRDTTAQAMSWCFYNLSQHPQVVAKIRAELADVLPDFASGRDVPPPTMDQVQQLVYLDAVLALGRPRNRQAHQRVVVQVRDFQRWATILYRHELGYARDEDRDGECDEPIQCRVGGCRQR